MDLTRGSTFVLLAWAALLSLGSAARADHCGRYTHWAGEAWARVEGWELLELSGAEDSARGDEVPSRHGCSGPSCSKGPMDPLPVSASTPGGGWGGASRWALVVEVPRPEDGPGFMLERAGILARSIVVKPFVFHPPRIQSLGVA